ncbi:MAG: 4Fe-4S dicluster domain-containing protein, partial [Lachnospiraceae bacterium]|nr:4Fe-4S dicluster domain-containing protein [Lachnospiraceae bacterium]MDD3661203.1 4Fe-4S dicluster domain-containing protein [Lachnospiraceae bacterium]
GFSVHGSLAVMKRFLDAYGEDLEFGQIQMNYLDWSFQDAKGKADLLKQFDIPIWVMEPLRGGSLSKLASEYEERLTMLRPEEKIPAWGFRFLQSIPEVTVILSGMSTYEQLEENIATFEEERPLTQDERKCLLKIADEMLVKKTVPCTACRYCTSHCPMELDIPRLIGLYNEYTVTGGGFIAPMVVGVLPENKRPSACIGCKSCEQVCPQQIQISVVMKEFSDALK